MEQNPAGWYPDPDNLLQERLWDGSEWVDRVRPRKPTAGLREDAVNGAVVVNAPQPIPGTLADDTEVVYVIPRTAEKAGGVQALEHALQEKGIDYYWEEGELVVDKRWEAQVDDLVQLHTPKTVEGVGGPRSHNTFLVWGVIGILACAGVVVANRDAVLGFVRGTFLNNKQAEAACVTRGGMWKRDSQYCDTFFAPDGDVEVACIARGGSWNRIINMCTGGSTTAVAPPVYEPTWDDKVAVFAETCSNTSPYRSTSTSYRYDTLTGVCHATDIASGYTTRLCLGIDEEVKIYPDPLCS